MMNNKNKQNHKPIRRGDCILTELPFAYVLKSKYRKERCDNCLEKCKVLKCSNCNYAYYCSRGCQKKSWAIHKIECPFLKSIYPRNVPDAARMLCRLIIKLNNGADMERSYYTETDFRKFRDLMSHYTEIKNDSNRMQHLESLHAVLSEMMSGSAIVPNEAELLSIYGRLVTNGFNILDAEMNSIATAIYLAVSILDHSCNPNALATFEGTTLHIHVTEDMPILDWNKVFISYIDLLNVPEVRNKELLRNYYFVCTCTKCTDPQEIKEMNAAACANKACKEFLDINLKTCPKCGTSITSEYRTLFNDVTKLTQNHLENMEEVAYLDVSKVCLQKQKKCLHPLNLWHIKTLDAAFEAAIEMGKWSEALEYGMELLSGFRKYYGDWSPLLGLLYMKVAKLQLYNCSSNEAARNLEKAKQILEVTHGRNHSLIREQLMELLLQANMESINSIKILS